MLVRISQKRDVEKAATFCCILLEYFVTKSASHDIRYFLSARPVLVKAEKGDIKPEVFAYCYAPLTILIFVGRSNNLSDAHK